MGFLIGSPDADNQEGQVVRVGTNGSSFVLCALLFAGYAVGSWKESRRVLRWVDVAPGLPDSDFYHLRSRLSPRAFLREVLARNDNNCAWVMLRHTSSGPTINTGLRRQPVRCPIPAALTSFYRL